MAWLTTPSRTGAVQRYYDAMLEQARELFSARGYAATSIRDITARVGSSEALVYRYFGSKEELFRKSVISSFDAALCDYTSAPVGDVEDEISRLHDFCSRHAALLRTLIASSVLEHEPASGLTRSGSPLQPIFDRLTAVFIAPVAVRACVGFVMATAVFDTWLFDGAHPTPPRRRAVEHVSALMRYGCTGRPTDEPPTPPGPEPPPPGRPGAVAGVRVRERVPPGRRQRRSRHEVRRLVLEAARELFSEYGYHATTTRAIAERAGVAETSVFRHFEGKPALFESAVFGSFQNWVEAYLSRWGLTGRTRPSFEEQTRDYIGATYDMLAENGPLLRSALAGNAFQDSATSPLHEVFVRLEYQLAVLAQRNRLMGVDAVLVIRPTFGMLYTMAVLPEWIFGTTIPPRSELIRELTGIMVYGIAGRA